MLRFGTKVKATLAHSSTESLMKFEFVVLPIVKTYQLEKCQRKLNGSATYIIIQQL